MWYRILKHAKITASWDIKSKGESYALKQTTWQSNKICSINEMDATISFWIANSGKSGTLFSNGKEMVLI
jgi:hypothetical protein